MTAQTEFDRTLYLDMDGVLVDFDSEYQKRFDISLETRNQMASEYFWKVFNTNSKNFFLEAPPYQDTIKSVSTIRELSIEHKFNLEILTALPKMSRYPSAKFEKRAWLVMHGLDLIPFNVGPFAEDKHKHCQKGDILIDDNVLNIVQWNDSGGIGIFHHNWPATIKYLTTVLTHESSK